jgi:hypothetical protein
MGVYCNRCSIGWSTTRFDSARRERDWLVHARQLVAAPLPSRRASAASCDDHVAGGSGEESQHAAFPTPGQLCPSYPCHVLHHVLHHCQYQRCARPKVLIAHMRGTAATAAAAIPSTASKPGRSFTTSTSARTGRTALPVSLLPNMAATCRNETGAVELDHDWRGGSGWCN